MFVPQPHLHCQQYHLFVPQPHLHCQQHHLFVPQSHLHCQQHHLFVPQPHLHCQQHHFLFVTILVEIVHAIMREFTVYNLTVQRVDFLDEIQLIVVITDSSVSNKICCISLGSLKSRSCQYRILPCYMHFNETFKRWLTKQLLLILYVRWYRKRFNKLQNSYIFQSQRLFH